MTNNTQRSVEEIANKLADKIHACYQGADLVQNQYAELIAEAIISERQEADKLRQENEALKAQVEGLVEALDKVFKWEFDFRGDCVADAKTVAKKALSTLPSTFLEIQKAKDAVIEASEQIKDLHVGQKFLKLQEALRTLQQVQEKK